MLGKSIRGTSGSFGIGTTAPTAKLDVRKRSNEDPKSSIWAIAADMLLRNDNVSSVNIDDSILEKLIKEGYLEDSVDKDGLFVVIESSKKTYKICRFDESVKYAKEPKIDIPDLILSHTTGNFPLRNIELVGYSKLLNFSPEEILYIYWNRDKYNTVTHKDDWSNEQRILFSKKEDEYQRIRWAMREIVDVYAATFYKKDINNLLATADTADDSNDPRDKSFPTSINVQLPGQDIYELWGENLIDKYESKQKELEKMIEKFREYTYCDRLMDLRKRAISLLSDEVAIWVVDSTEKGAEQSYIDQKKKQHAEFVLKHLNMLDYYKLFSENPAPLDHRKNILAPSVMSSM